jgi:hypothetical protein
MFRAQYSMIKIIFILLIQVSLVAQQHYVQIVFSEKMQLQTILDKNNYTLYDQSMQIKPIDRVGAINDSIVVLFVPYLDYKTNYLVKVENVKDLAGNYINNKNTAWFRFDGFDFGQDKPNFKIRRK